MKSNAAKISALILLGILLGALNLFAANDVSTNATLPTNLASWWDLDEVSGTRNDSKSTNHLTDVNTVASAAGKQGNAAVFVNASAEYLEKGTPSGLPTGSSARSVSFCVNTTLASELAVLSWYNANALGEFGVKIDSNLVGVRLQGGNGFWTATNINNGSWHHIVITYAGGTFNSTNAKAYMDGSALTFSSGGAATPNTGATTFRIGSDRDNNHFTGTIDTVGIWSKVLSSTEISDLYNSGNCLPYTDTSTPASAPVFQDAIWFD